MPYVSSRAVLGDDAATTTNTATNMGPGPTLQQQVTQQLAVEKAGASSSAFDNNAYQELSHEDYAQAVATGTVPAYVTSPADQKTFTTLIDQINANGFTSLSPQDQVTFNALRTTGTTDIDAAKVGGAESGVFTDEGTDLPPNADVINKDIARDTAPGYTPPPPPPPAGRPYTIRNGVYVYLDDGSAISAADMARLGLAVVNTSTGTTTPPAADNTGPSAAANYPITTSSVAPSDASGPMMAPPPVLIDSPALVPSSSKALWLIGGGVGALGLAAFIASRHSHPRS